VGLLRGRDQRDEEKKKGIDNKRAKKKLFSPGRFRMLKRHPIVSNTRGRFFPTRLML
jgi:hypothetical protein